MGKLKSTSDMFRDRFQVDAALQVRILGLALQLSWVFLVLVETMNDDCQTHCG